MPTEDTQDLVARADTAARSVTRAFGKRLLFLPGTHLGASVRPQNPLRALLEPWNYWWQAHYVDCLVDTGRRELAAGVKFDGASRPSAGRLASRLVTTVRLRNFLRFVNSYYDDMAWLALATLRLEDLAEQSRHTGRGSGRRRNARVRESLTLQFDSASTEDLGGGTFWNIARDFKNTPATAPVALYYARTGRRESAQRLLDWLNARLFDPERGLYQDGLRIQGTGTVLVADIYTYNQGPVLGALLELGGEENMQRASALIEAVARALTLNGTNVVKCHGDGDGGLFTGILLRYLALAAADNRLPESGRQQARQMVLDTADAFWAGRAETEPLTFSSDPLRPADKTYPPGSAVELSTQLQAWMALEAAASLAN
ncbi:glycoside hydrolase family 76 protein [Arthrobacter cupressi]|uniref:Predicted alpha-1,6-mannanase, GH76 family n=1 Tax=Arthrobacter cupressi TaxID=1045773 RepID=A0A1G8V7M3_9MICC|nr:glycoside hydrolase family 76 protein [Arthrobacter cupressi]NYD78669.1 putative alpha-1,6-mannanase (GH76 family) [Arthrobacter cupressi]SDJ61884.1 Predicted alpha-1,6-mannanase, GH76 family [Arthrobacter cupressi]